MPTTPVSLAARERLREHHSAAAKAVAKHSTALVHLDTVAARRQKLVAQQDALVTTAQNQVDAAVAEAANIMGIEVAAAVLNLSKSEVQRLVREARRSGD